MTEVKQPEQLPIETRKEFARLLNQLPVAHENKEPYYRVVDLTDETIQTLKNIGLSDEDIDDYKNRAEEFFGETDRVCIIDIGINEDIADMVLNGELIVFEFVTVLPIEGEPIIAFYRDKEGKAHIYGQNSDYQKVITRPLDSEEITNLTAFVTPQGVLS